MECRLMHETTDYKWHLVASSMAGRKKSHNIQILSRCRNTVEFNILDAIQWLPTPLTYERWIPGNKGNKLRVKFKSFIASIQYYWVNQFKAKERGKSFEGRTIPLRYHVEYRHRGALSPSSAWQFSGMMKKWQRMLCKEYGNLWHRQPHHCVRDRSVLVSAFKVSALGLEAQSEPTTYEQKEKLHTRGKLVTISKQINTLNKKTKVREKIELNILGWWSLS